MNKNEIITACMDLNLSDLRDINSAVVNMIRAEQTKREQVAASAFRAGSRAKFFSSKKGRWITIEIEKINRKSVNGREVHEPDGTLTMHTWRVSPSLLQPV